MDEAKILASKVTVLDVKMDLPKKSILPNQD